MSKRKPTRSPVSTRRSASGRQRQRLRLGAKPGSRWFGWTVAAGVVVVAVVAVIAVSASGNGGSPATGAGAPDGGFTTTSGATETVSSLRGRPALLWFVTTWCSSCQAGTQAMASKVGRLAALGVRVVELENAGDLGQSGPSITAFAQLAGPASRNPDWTWGVAASSLTTLYNPHGYLDIYYLLNAQGRVVYVNSSPAATMGELLAKASQLSARA